MRQSSDDDKKYILLFHKFHKCFLFLFTINVMKRFIVCNIDTESATKFLWAGVVFNDTCSLTIIIYICVNNSRYQLI